MSNETQECRKLSVAMIVRDAEHCLAATLDCVRNLADEIVVLDTGSQDSTIRIARQKATKVASAAWTDDFSAARNAVLELATGDWVLWLDAGETLSPETAEALRTFIDREADAATAYYLLVRTPPQGANIAGEQVARIRLHPRVPRLAFHGRVRESLQPSLSQLGLKTAGLAYTLSRTAQEHSPIVRKQRAERNLHLVRLAIKDEGASPGLLNCAGEASQAIGDSIASARFHREALEQGEAGSNDMLEAYYGLLTALEGEPNCRDAQLQLCMKGLEHFPIDAQLLCAIGGYLQSKEQLELASRAYQLSAEHGQLSLEIWHLEGMQEIATNCYAHTLQLLGREAEAVELLDQRLAANPQSARLRRQLLELHVRGARADAALAVVNNIPRNVPNREALRSAVRGACLAADGDWGAAKPYLDTAFKSGCREPLALDWLTQTLFALGKPDDAAIVLEEWSRVDPLSPALRSARDLLLQEPEGAERRTLRVDAKVCGGVAMPRLGSLPSMPSSTCGK